ncbi:fibromodulin a [Trichomycterus rosablanca]|uniref:fibromodulin a n=1 Tax=Trichomycterus rosablanca TaxID=2290929 RepID=UPI002F351ABE
MHRVVLLMAGLLQLILAQNNDPLHWIYRLHPMAALNADKTGGDCPAECDCPPTFPIAMYCNNRGLKQIPYIPSRIKYVYLQHNQITTVSDKAFGNATDLIWVMLHENQIEKIENRAFADLVNLDRLYLSGNNLTEVPANLPRSLRDLRLNHNKISKVSPDALNGMKNLTFLLLNDNNIQEIEGSLKDLKSLTLLNVGGNQLKKIPSGLPDMLHQLYLDSNSIDSIPENYFNPLSNLQYVRLSHNALTDKGIPPNTFNISGLIELDLSYNKLERIPPVSASLEYLYLQVNNIKEFTLGSFCSVVDVINFSKLKVLRMEGNEIARSDIPTESALCLRLASDIAL